MMFSANAKVGVRGATEQLCKALHNCSVATISPSTDVQYTVDLPRLQDRDRPCAKLRQLLSPFHGLNI